MCRWISYLGPAIPMDMLLVKTENSLAVQSKKAKEGKEATNGDGFGVGWYSDRNEAPGVYREVRPAWNDDNLRDISAHIASPLFMGHVRAATGTPVQRTNCHPFHYGRWLFQHNGLINSFKLVRRQLLLDVDPALFNHIQGSSDSELIFHLALTFGLEADPLGALAKTIGHVERALDDAGIVPDVHFSASLADGETLYAVRYSSVKQSRTLYYTRDVEAAQRAYPDADFDSGAYTLVVSEPLGGVAEWTAVPESTSIVARGSDVAMQPFAPA